MVEQSQVTARRQQTPSVIPKGRKRQAKISALHDRLATPSDESGVALWYDSRALSALSEPRCRAVRGRVFQGLFNGMCLYADNFRELAPSLPGRFARVLHVSEVDEWKKNAEAISPSPSGGGKITMDVIASGDPEVLRLAKAAGFRSCLRIGVDDAKSLHDSFRNGARHDYLMVSFKDPTNIPLELVIAELHDTETIVLKETGVDVDDAIIALGVLELGSDGVITSFTEMAQFDALARRLDASLRSQLELQTGIVVRTRHLGLGHRSCIDTTHLFAPNEGLLVGSTSGGGILCCPEVFHLPYMELRPFRVNAASVHSYVFHADDRTSYISELRAGSALTVVEATGRTRPIYVGRVKTEIRPLILIEAKFPGDRAVNIVMQDDWHVRVFSDEALPLNVTELKSGDKVLGYTTELGRHVGVRVDEHIVEQ